MKIVSSQLLAMASAIMAITATPALAASTRNSMPTAQLVNPGQNQCIVTGERSAAYSMTSLQLGNCTNGTPLVLVMVPQPGHGSSFKLQDSTSTNCVSAVAAGPLPATQVALLSCTVTDPRQIWTQIPSTQQWQNGFGFCLDFVMLNNGTVASMVQNPCVTGGSNSQSYVLYHQPAPPAPTSAPAPTPAPTPSAPTCGSWAMIVNPGAPLSACGANYAFDSTRAATTCNLGGVNGFTCQSLCCTPTFTPPQIWQMCGAWSVGRGGPGNACGFGSTYSAGQYTTCSSTGSDCVQNCCTPTFTPAPAPAPTPTPTPTPEPQVFSCSAFSVQNGGPFNACGDGYSYTANDGDMCNSDGSDCVAQCCTQLLS